MKRGEQGITLVALVVTIIILIILAGVSVTMVLGENGLIAKAKEAKQKTEQAIENEKMQFLQAEVAMNFEGKEYTDESSKLQNKTVKIPAGFTISSTEEERHIDTGLVIIDTNGNEFVWVPINDIFSMATKTNGIDNNGRTNFQGKLYDFKGIRSSEMIDYGQFTNKNREPSNLPNFDTDNIIEHWTDTIYQEEYNEMVESVIENKGFYIGRYETNFNNDIVESKKNVITANLSNLNWFKMYEKSKHYDNASVKSSMIWGSQWDAMLNWILTGNDKEKVTQSNNASHDLTSSYKSGSNNNDKINNIYDLEGNIREFTLEANETSFRIVRGGMYDSSSSPSFRLSRYNPGTSYYYNGSRLVLYII